MNTGFGFRGWASVASMTAGAVPKLQSGGVALPRPWRGAFCVCRGRTGASAFSPAPISPSLPALFTMMSGVI